MRVKAMASLLIASATFFTVQATADVSELTAKPNKCVALRKGKTCYETIVLLYTATQKSDFCLMLDGEDDPLACWTDTAQAQYRYRLASSTSLEFRIIDSEQAPLAHATVRVVWVYRQPRKRNRWRLF